MDRTEAAKHLEKSKPSLAIRKTITEELGNDTASKIWVRAIVILADIYGGYPSFTKDEYMHVKGIFNAVALYKSLQEHCPERAMELMEKGMAANAVQRARSYKRMVKMPFGRTIFLKGFAAGTKSAFGEKSGFKHDFHHADSDDVRFDVLQCPYVRYTTEQGCPEHTHIFCNNEIYAYGYLKGVVFERQGTLGTGYDRCDFHLYKTGASK